MKDGTAPDAGLTTSGRPRRIIAVEPWAARRGCGMKYGAPQRAGWYLDRGERVSWEVPLAGPTERSLTRPKRGRCALLDERNRLGRDSKQCAQHPGGKDAEHSTMFLQAFVVAKQWPNEMEFSGERSESAATTG
jgi:hypothetical protein